MSECVPLEEFIEEDQVEKNPVIMQCLPFSTYKFVILTRENKSVLWSLKGPRLNEVAFDSLINEL